MSTPLVGILVGGKSARMNGVPKGALPHGDDGESIVARLVRLARARRLDVVLVGAVLDDDPYAHVEAPRIADASPACGPLSGVVALLEHARGRDVLALACDLPALPPSVIDRLANEHGTIAPRIDGRWEPLVARYAAEVLPIARAQLDAGKGALHALLDGRARTLALDDTECAALFDWDSPEDFGRSRRKEL